MNLDEYRHTSYQTWQEIASGWERQRARIDEFAAPVREWLIRELAPQPGQKVLELSAGPGDTGFEAAAMVGERGRVISSDFAPEMVEVARRRGTKLGLRNVDYRVIDAERIDLDADSVDRVICRFGYMATADRAAAIAETRRVLRPGGRLALSVWSAPERNPWASIAGMILVERGHMPPPDPEGPGVFSMASQERTRALLENGGFGTVDMAEVPVRFVFRDLDDYLSFTIDTAGPLAMAIRGLPDEERETIKAQLGEAFAPFGADAGYEFPGVSLNAVAS